jgi:hypothetical protein
MALVFLALRQALLIFVPWAMRLAVAAEGLAYRPNAPSQVITPFAYPTAILFAALVVDLAAWLARRRGMSGDRAILTTAVVASVLVTFWDRPWTRYLPTYYPGLDTGTMLIHSLPFTIVAAIASAGAAVLLSRGLAATRN